MAAEQGLEPQEYADRILGVWQEVPSRVNATNDFFSRTSDDGHKAFEPHDHHAVSPWQQTGTLQLHRVMDGLLCEGKVRPAIVSESIMTPAYDR